jgi:light-independent protochlorophyllide reductase subunit B
MFREDFEFGDGRAPSHLGGHATSAREEPVAAPGLLRGPAGEEPSATAPAVPAPAVPARAVEAAPEPVAAEVSAPARADGGGSLTWTTEAEKELKKIPFFVRGKASRNTEKYARERGVATITLETLYEAKAHFRS